MLVPLLVGDDQRSRTIITADKRCQAGDCPSALHRVGMLAGTAPNVHHGRFGRRHLARDTPDLRLVVDDEHPHDLEAGPSASPRQRLVACQVRDDTDVVPKIRLDPQRRPKLPE